MDLACFETFMKAKGWEKPSFGVAPNKSPDGISCYTILDISFRKGTRTVLAQAEEIEAMDGESFDSWYQEKTKGFLF
jgi:hypothetical protein